MDQMFCNRFNYLSGFQPHLDRLYGSSEGPAEEGSPLRQAVRAGDLSRVKKLIVSYRFEINQPNSRGWTLLHEAAVNDRFAAIVRFLISAGAQPDYRTRNGVTPLYVASKNGCVAIARILIAAGCKVNTMFNYDEDSGRFIHYNFTCLHIACTRQNADIVKVLIENNADVNARDDIGKTPIYYAIDSVNIGGIRLLIAAGADLLVKDSHGNSPMHYVTMLGHMEIFDLVRYVFWDQTVLNDCSYDGYTPLMCACQFKHYAIAEELIRLGADTTLVDNDGFLAIHIATRAGLGMFKLLLNNTPKDVIEKHSKFGCGTDKWRSLPCLLIESQYFDSLELLYRSGFSEDTLKCPDKFKGHLVSPVVYLLLHNNRWFDREYRLKFLEFLLTFDYLVDPIYEKEIKTTDDKNNHSFWGDSLEKLKCYPEKRINSVEAVVQMHSHLHRDCYCGLFLSMILSRLGSPDKYLPKEPTRQLSLFNESAREGFIEGLHLLQYAEYVEPDDVMDMFIRQMSTPAYTWGGHEELVVNFLLNKCIANFIPAFKKLKDSLPEPRGFNERQRFEGVRNLYQIVNANTGLASLKSMSRLAMRKQIRKEAEASSMGFQSYLKNISLPHSLHTYILYNENF